MGHLGWAERKMRLKWFGLFAKVMASTPRAKDRGHACRTPGSREHSVRTTEESPPWTGNHLPPPPVPGAGPSHHI